MYRGDHELSNSMLADDLVLFVKATKDHARLIKSCLERFCAISRQKISHEKSRVTFLANVCLSDAAIINESLRIPMADELGKYLGVPTLSKRVTKSTFQYIVDRVDKQLTGWRTKCLSLVGRTPLIKATLTTILACAMQTCRVPRTIYDELD